MSARFFIIDNNASFRVKLTQMLKSEWPGAKVEQFEPATQGWPGEATDWSGYDLLFLDHSLRAGNGADGYEALKHKPHFPPTVITSVQPDPEIAVRVIKAGADNYLPKQQLSREKLKEIVLEIFSRRGPTAVSKAGSVIATDPSGNMVIKNENTGSSVRITVAPSAAEAEIEKTQVMSAVRIEETPSRQSEAAVEKTQVIGSAQLPPDLDSTFQPQPAAAGDKKSKIIRLPKKSANTDSWPSIAGYKILQKIGQGGMSTIFLAERATDKKQIVIKTLSMAMIDNKKTVTRANQEFKLISRIKNRHIVELLDQGTIGDVLYTIMEYFQSGDLKQRLRDGIKQRDALDYMRQIADGLNAIHGCGIIHRDLKPGNIMFREDNSLAIIDFGISKDINSTLDLTSPGQIMGTPNYMAPEQGKGAYKPDARSDIYSLGIMLYEMLTGKKPYAAPTGAAILYKHLHDPIPHLPNQFYEVQPLLDRMLAKFPHQRFQSAYDLIQYIDKEFRWDLTLDFK
jgi:DNA-binding NarL/FixJ family response regulator/tRNA A-37 threonylcarbamoyl transferase component Bud32